ncbi:hypothetical protein D3C81_1511890 [compost metagenome]
MGVATSTLMINGLLKMLLQILHGSDLRSGLYTASTTADSELYRRITRPARTAPNEIP